MKIVVDMNLSPRWVDFLGNAGIEAVHWSKIGSPQATDHEIMTVARNGGFIVLTHDLDFSAILAATQGNKPSVVQIRAEDLSPESIAGFVIAALIQMSTELDVGALLTVDPTRTRVRMLPLR